MANHFAAKCQSNLSQWQTTHGKVVCHMWQTTLPPLLPNIFQHVVCNVWQTALPHMAKWFAMCIKVLNRVISGAATSIGDFSLLG
jgi:hypothetical protein